jgi:hypothetical protein
MSYHVRGYMAFRLNDLGHGLDHGIVCHNNPITETCVALGMTGNTADAVFHFVTWKVLFLKSGVFMRQQSKQNFQSWTQHPNLLIDHLWYAYPCSFDTETFRCIFWILHKLQPTLLEAGSKSGINNSKKTKNMLDLGMASFPWPSCEKI